MSGRDPGRDSEWLAALPDLPRDEGEPVFAEPGQAQAFAMAVKLSEQGYFTGRSGPKRTATRRTASRSCSTPPTPDLRGAFS